MSPPPSRPGIFALLVDRPVLTGMIVLAMLVVGGIALLRLPLTFMGDAMASGNVRVWINSSRSASPEENQDKIARPTEELLRTIPGLRQIRADSSRSGVNFRIEYAKGMDARLAAAEIRDRLQRAMLEWPEGVDRYFLWRQDGSSAPLQMIQVLTPVYSQEWMEKVETIVQPRLEAVDGIGQVQFWGLNKQSIVIWFDRDKLNANRVDYRALLQRLASDNYSAPAGELRAESSRVLVRVDSRIRGVKDIENFVIRPGLCIKDVARVGYDRRDERSFSRYNERYTMSGSVRATSETNPVEASARVRAACEELKQDPRLKGMDFRFWFDQGEFIKSGLDSLKTSSLQGGLLAVLVLFLFLRNLRATLAIAVAIPLTLMLVADYLYFSGSSLNILTMTGMTLAVGMVIDNSVVVLENIRRLRHEGLDLRSTCIQGAREVSLAVTMATLTTVVVFAPMIFLISDPRLGSMAAAVGGPLSVALLSSLFVALLLLPSAVRRLGGMSAQSERQLSRWSPIQLMTDWTAKGVPWLLRWRYVLCLGLFSALASQPFLGTWMLPNLEFESGDKSPFRSGDVAFKLALPKGMDIEDVHAEVRRYEKVLREHKTAWKIESYRARYSRTEISLDMELLDEVRPEEQADLRDVIRKGLPQRPGIKIVLRGQEDNSSAEEDRRNFVVRIRGRDAATLTRIAQQIAERLGRHSDVETTEVAGLTDNKEVVMNVDRERLQDLAVMPESLFGTLRGGLQGRDISRIQKDDREVRVIAQYGDQAEASMDDLKETQVFSSRGAFQRLADLGAIEFEPMLPGITRIDGRTTATVLGRRKTGVGPKEFTATLKRILSNYSFPQGYSWIEDSPARDTAAQIKELAVAGLLSVLLVFFLMGILFESVVLPSAILSTIGVALLGGLWSLKAYGSIDPLAITGLIILAGVVVNNGIVLLDCIERLRRGGMIRTDAIREGIRIRLRPIVMTAATTVVGLLPMALFGEATGQGISYKSMSIAVAGGLTLCTMLTAPCVALAYAVLDDISRFMIRVLRQGFAAWSEPAKPFHRAGA